MIIALLTLLSTFAAEPVGNDEDWQVDGKRPADAVPPEFPAGAAQAQASGVCWLEFDVDEHGWPENFCTRCSARTTAFDTARENESAALYAAREFVHSAKSAVRQWRFDEQYRPMKNSRQALIFTLEGHDREDLPGPPRNLPCAEYAQT